MNIWTERSIELANQFDYLDRLFKIYPMADNLRRKINQQDIQQIKQYYENKNTLELLNILLEQEIFPLKDSYIAYLKRDKTAIHRNPQTVNRIVSAIYQMEFNEILDKITQPKETNRQIGPLFKKWLNSAFAYPVTDNEEEFLSYNQGAIIFNASDNKMQEIAKKYFGYNRNKGLDFIAKNNHNVLIGEAKFLTDFGGHQNAQFEDAINTLTYPLEKTQYRVNTIAILDGVLYIHGKNKLYSTLQKFDDNKIITSALFLKDILCTL